MMDSEPEFNNNKKKNTKEWTYKSGTVVIGNNTGPGGPNTHSGTMQCCRVQEESAGDNLEHMSVLFKPKITRYYLRDTQKEYAMTQIMLITRIVGELEAYIYL